MSPHLPIGPRRRGRPKLACACCGVRVSETGSTLGTPHAFGCTLDPRTLEAQEASARARLAGWTHPGYSDVPKPRRVSHGADPFRWVHPAWPADLKRWMLGALKSRRGGKCRVEAGKAIPLSFFDGMVAS